MMEKAVALSYNNLLPAPFIAGKGTGRTAERIVAIAQHYGIPVVEDDNLLESLFLLDTDTFIPEKVFQVVAELIIFARQLRGIHE